MSSAPLSNDDLRRVFQELCDREVEPAAARHGLARKAPSDEMDRARFSPVERRWYAGDGLELRVYLVRDLVRKASFLAVGFALDGPPLPGAPDHHFVLSDLHVSAALGIDRARRPDLRADPSEEELAESVTHALVSIEAILAQQERARRVLQDLEERLLRRRRSRIARGLDSPLLRHWTSDEVRYRPTLQDHVAMVKRHAETSAVFVAAAKASRKRFLILILPLMVVGTVALLTTLMSLRGVQPRDALLASAVLTGIFSLGWLAIGTSLNTFLVRIRAKTIRAASKASPSVYDVPHALFAGEQALTVVRGADLTQLPWRSVTGIETSSDHLVIDLAGRTPVMVPLTAFDTPDKAQEFEQRLRDLRDVATVAPVEGAGPDDPPAPGRLA